MPRNNRVALIKARALDYVRHVTCTVVDKPWARAGTREDEDDEEEEEEEEEKEEEKEEEEEEED